MSESPALPPCAWCGEESVTEVVTVPGKKNKRYSPVCETHAEKFERQGQKTRRMETDHLAARETRRAQYMRENMPWMNRRT